MGSKDKFYGINSAIHGFDDIGFNGGTGTISAVAKYGAGKYSKYAMVTESAAHNLVRGQQVNIAGTTDYDGPSIVVAIASTTKYVIKRPFTVTKTGTRDSKAGEANWDAFMPIGSDLPAGSVTIQYWKPEMQGGGASGPFADFSKDKVYVTPGGIRKITLATGATAAGGTAGTNINVRLFRAASVRPGAVKSLIAPTIVGYNPTGGTAGQSIDILGKNFDPALSNNVVTFSNGATAVNAYPTSIDQEGNIITVPVPAGLGATSTVAVKTNGMNATGPTVFNIA
jgi:hypothetical protein